MKEKDKLNKTTSTLNIKKKQFEIKPLDVNIAKMQYNLITGCENMLQNNNFTPIIERYINKDLRLNLLEIKAICESYQNNIPKNTMVTLIISVKFKNNNQKTIKLFKGTKLELLEYLKTKDFFIKTKELAKIQ